MTVPIEGFSKLTKEEKIDWLTNTYCKNPEAAKETLRHYWNLDKKLQNVHDEFIENTLTNFYLPLGIAPNFLINGQLYAIPMAIEESSVVAAASKAAKFWGNKGGFRVNVLGTEKVGQVHFMYCGDVQRLQGFFREKKPIFFKNAEYLTQNMQNRGGGITDIVLIDKTKEMPNYFQLHGTFETADAMGANFINSCLENFAKTLQEEAANYTNFNEREQKIEVVMSILSNYVPHCIVRVSVSCTIEDLADDKEVGQEFANRFIQAIRIAEVEPYRAVTHNKGIMNGIDAVVQATGNDFRAIEAGVHAYASKDGQYTSLSHAEILDGIFTFWMEVPLALGTVGGLTSIHPMAQLALEILQKPNAKELMQIVAVAGLAQNFAAVSSLVTTGIQHGHMKMHLMNILNQLGASEDEKKQLKKYFKTRTINYSAVESALNSFRD